MSTSKIKSMFNDVFTILLENSGLKKDADWARFVVQCLILTFILHVIAAVKSSGFYHADEHFQIIEFMNYKLGRSPAIDLPLEYGQLMRPWLMSAIFAGLTVIWRALGVDSPFDWALGYRLCCAGVGFLSTVGLTLNCYRWFPAKSGRRIQWRTYAVLALTLIWYLPALHARHSSENVSGSVFFIALGFLALYLPLKAPRTTTCMTRETTLDNDLNNDGRQIDRLPAVLACTVGVLFGLAFEFRYQTGFMILGALFWLVLIARISLRSFLLILTTAFIPFVLGTLADRWGYGQWTFAPWNYVKYNLVQNHVSDSDVSPWWDYFRRALTESWPPLGLLLLLSFPIAWLRSPKHILTWSMVPLFLTHEIIGHKELRFLFPLIHAGPVLLIMSIQGLTTGSKTAWKGLSERLYKIVRRDGQHGRFRWLAWRIVRRIVRRIRWGIIWGIVVMNSIALVFTTILPAWSPIRFYEQLYRFSPYGFQLYYKDDSLFDFGGSRMNFYKPNHLPLVHVKEYTEVVQALNDRHLPIWLFTPRLAIPLVLRTTTQRPDTLGTSATLETPAGATAGDLSGELKPHCVVEFSTWPAWPAWIERLNPFGIPGRITNWTLHRCENRGRDIRLKR